MERQIEEILIKLKQSVLSPEEADLLLSYISTQKTKIENFKQTVDLLLENNKKEHEENDELKARIMHVKYQVNKLIELLDHE